MSDQDDRDKDLRIKVTSWMKQIDNEVSRLIIDQYIYDEAQEIVKANPKIQKPSSFYDMVSNGYAVTCVMGIRRLVDNHKDCVSFFTLINKLLNNRPTFNRKWHVGLWGDPPGASHSLGNIRPEDREAVVKLLDESMSEDHFKRANHLFDQYAGEGNEELDPKILEADKEEMIKAAEKVQHYADRRVAHRDKKDPSAIVTYNDLDECIKLFEKMCIRYDLLIRVSSASKLLPTWQYDWKEIFYHPWIEIKSHGSSLDEPSAKR